MKILPHIGFAEVKLGQLKQEVINELGDDFETEADTDNDDITSTTLFYDELGCALTFSSNDDYKLGTITFYSPDFLLHGLELIGLSEEEFLVAAKTKIQDIKLDDDFEDVNSKDYVSDSQGLSFWIQDGFVDSVSMFPEFADDEDTVLWPD